MGESRHRALRDEVGQVCSSDQAVLVTENILEELLKLLPCQALPRVFGAQEMFHLTS